MSEDVTNDGVRTESQPSGQTPQLENQLFDTLQNIESDYGKFKNNMEDLRQNLTHFVQNTEERLSKMREEARRKVDEEEVDKKVKTVKGKVTDVDRKLHDVMDEIGYGETLDVSKIPPGILESVYETTLEDVVTNLRQNLGDRATQQIVTDTLEMMRTRTSGSELFQFDGRRINVRNLVNSIETKLISAKQVHSTYTELLKKLVENVPGFEPRNFRAMMKSKGLEFAIDKTTRLVKKVDKLEDNISSNSQILNSLMNRVNNVSTDINQRMDGIEKKVTTKLDEGTQMLEQKLDDIFSRIEDLETIWGHLDELKETAEKYEILERKFNEETAAYEMKLSSLENELEEMKENLPDDSTPSFDMEEEERFVYYSIPSDGGTLSKIEGIVGDVVSDVEERLESMTDKGLVKREQRGRWMVYQRVETVEDEEFVEEEDIYDEDYTVLSHIPEDGCTLARLNREIEELEEEEIEEILERLIDDDQVFTTKRNRWTIYMKVEESKEVT